MEQVAVEARISRRGGGFPRDEACEERGIMVLLVKHVHLQKDGGAGHRQPCCVELHRSYLQAATSDIRMA
jgi:hypothetical protein